MTDPRETDDIAVYVVGADGKPTIGTLKQLRNQAWNMMLRDRNSTGQMIGLLGEAIAGLEHEIIRLRQELR